MNIRNQIVSRVAWLGLAALILATAGTVVSAAPVNVKAEAGRGAAAAGNQNEAQVVVLVSDPVTGQGINNLVKADFALRHFGSPLGSQCGFTNGITNVVKIDAGVYQIFFRLRTDLVTSCRWVAEDYIGSIRVVTSQYAGHDGFLLRMK